MELLRAVIDLFHPISGYILSFKCRCFQLLCFIEFSQGSYASWKTIFQGKVKKIRETDVFFFLFQPQS